MNDEFDILYFRKIFPREGLQQLQDAICDTTKIAMSTRRPDGTPLTTDRSQHIFCSDFNKCSPTCLERCMKCDAEALEKVATAQGAIVYKCHNDMLEMIVPFFVAGNFVGALHGGQVFEHRPSDEELRARAVEFGLDPEAYLEASRAVPVVSREYMENLGNMLFKLSDMMTKIAAMGFEMKIGADAASREAHMKSDFLANMSHEIRTPMNAVIGMAEMALREEMTPIARDYIHQIKSSGKSLLTIINDILDFSKIESGKMDINLAEYNPLSIVQDVTNVISTRIGKKPLELIVNMDPNLPQLMMGDSVRIKQVITNLTNNAVKFTEHGQVELVISFEKTAEKMVDLKCAVNDTGIGIRKENLDKLFQSFNQVDSKRNRNVEGTGLGLAISKQLVELMGGSISVASVYGEGSSFMFHIPQLVLDDSPCVRIKDADKIHAVCYVKEQYVKKDLQRDIERLGVHQIFVDSNEELELALVDSPEFVFIDDPLVEAETINMPKNYPDTTFVFMTASNKKSNYRENNILSIHKPMYALNLGIIFNHEDLYGDTSESNEHVIDFIAPNANVLIVDDNEINLTVAEGLIQPLQMHVETALSGMSALEMISKKHYDIVFMDHMMPEMDGIEVTRKIRSEHEDYNNVPIIALTANAMEETKSMFLTEGMNDFIAKPVEVDVIVRKVRQWLPDDLIVPVDQSVVRNKANNLNEDESVLFQGLAENKDMDVKNAVSLLGSEKLFLKVVKDYYNASEKKIALLKTAFNEEDLATYKIEAHSLKSASRQIGFGELGDFAATMEKAAGEFDTSYITQNHEKLVDWYAKVASQLEPFFCKENEDDSKLPTIERAALYTIFATMTDAIDNLELDVVETNMEALMGYRFPAEQKEVRDNLKAAVESYDTDACMQEIENWKALL